MGLGHLRAGVVGKALRWRQEMNKTREGKTSSKHEGWGAGVRSLQVSYPCQGPWI